ncbi:MAG: S9 family peptidase [Gammaproteobacteria bacterium]|nr:S9 family peptidase [Gammaproteobacteria bacterium]
MIKRTLALAIALTTMVSVQAEPLTIERIFSDPALAGKSPKQLKFSPDGTRVTYLQGKSQDYNRYDLWQYSLDTGKNSLLVDSALLHSGPEMLSDEEKARRERQRIFGSGIMSYQWAKDGKALLFPLAGDVYYYRLGQDKARQLTHTPAFETDIKFSPKGTFVSYVRAQNLYILNIATGIERMITKDGGGVIKNAMAEFVAQEEMGRMSGYWWSPDESSIAFNRIDETPVPLVTRNEIYADSIKLIDQRYPAAGQNNVLVKLAVYSLKKKTTQWVDLGSEQDIYLPRVKWLPNSKRLSYQWQSRNQQTLKLFFYSLSKKTSQLILTEQADTWVNLNKDLRFLTQQPKFIWASERNGFKHLYLYNLDGTLDKQLTDGQWVINSLQAVNEFNGKVFFTGRADTPIEQHLYYTNLATKKPTAVSKVTKRAGFHHIKFSSDGHNYIDSYSNVSRPQQVSLHDDRGNRVTWLEKNALNTDHPLTPYLDQLAQPSFGTIKSQDGQDLYYRLFKPVDFDPTKKYPVIVRVYGGPHAQIVTDSWSNKNLWTQVMLKRGYLVFQLDNRGSNHRGTKFENAIYKHLGVAEIEDQIEGVKFLRSLDFVAPQRIGIYGHSYGGYMSLMALFKASDYFSAGVSGAPVTDWTLYDTHYTERYLSHPATNKSGYEQSAVFPFIDGYKGKLLIYHGMADDNVLFSNTTKLMSMMQNKALQFESMVYPGKKHSIRGKNTRIHQFNMIANFFDNNL